MDDLGLLAWCAQGDARRVRRRVADRVAAVIGKRGDLVERDPAVDPVAEPRGDGGGKVGEILRDLAALPAGVAVLQRLRQVPVVERGVRGDAVLAQAVHQPAVEVDALLVHGAAALRHDARPGDAESVVLHAEGGHQRDVVGHAVIVVAGNIHGAAVGDAAGLAAKRIPDARPAPVRGGGALYLDGRGGDAPFELGDFGSGGGGGRGGGIWRGEVERGRGECGGGQADALSEKLATAGGRGRRGGHVRKACFRAG